MIYIIIIVISKYYKTIINNLSWKLDTFICQQSLTAPGLLQIILLHFCIHGGWAELLSCGPPVLNSDYKTEVVNSEWQSYIQFVC